MPQKQQLDAYFYTFFVGKRKRESIIFHLQEEGREGWGDLCCLPERKTPSLSLCLEMLRLLERTPTLLLPYNLQYALWMLKLPVDKEVHFPLAFLFQGSCEEIEQQRKQALTLCKGGFRPTVKVKVQNLSVKEALALVELLLPDFTVRIDFNNSWNMEETVAFCSHLPASIAYLEDPSLSFVPETLSHLPWAHENKEPLVSSSIPIWKPVVKGVNIPPRSIISSSYESAIGIGGLLYLAQEKNSPYPVGAGNFFHMQQDLLEKPLEFYKGNLVCQSLRPQKKSLHFIERLRYTHPLL